MRDYITFLGIWAAFTLFGWGMLLLGTLDDGPPKGAFDYDKAVELCMDWKDEGLVYDNGFAGDPTFLTCVEMVRWTVAP